mgnify:CR=1 FL=1
MINIYKKKFNICIVANNIAGLGSMNVVSNLLYEFSNNLKFSQYSVYLNLPKIPFWERYQTKLNNKWVINFVYRSDYKFLRLFLRVFDLILGHLFLPKCDILIILGDFPIRIKTNQILLLHNSHIVDNENSNFRFHRFFFKLNHKFISTCFVQTDVMKQKLINLYPHFNNKVSSIKMPVNNIFNSTISFTNQSNKIRLFYPASYYVHKNHKIIWKLLKNHIAKLTNIMKFPKEVFADLDGIRIVILREEYENLIKKHERTKI